MFKKVKSTGSPCNDGNERPTTALYQSLSYVNVICHQRFSVEYITKSIYSYAVLNNLQRISLYTYLCIYKIIRHILYNIIFTYVTNLL